MEFQPLHTPLQRGLVRHPRTELAPYRIPRRFVSVEELPRGSTGKILKSKLAASLLALPGAT